MVGYIGRLWIYPKRPNRHLKDDGERPGLNRRSDEQPADTGLDLDTAAKVSVSNMFFDATAKKTV